MAAPCAGMAGRPLGQFLSCFRRTVALKTGLRQFSGSSMCRAASQAATVTERATSPWSLMAAVCLQRLPVISAESSPLEQRFRHMMQQMELEKSLLSDHELRLLEDAERMSRKQSDDYDSDEEDDGRDQDIVLAQDLEDSWEQKLKNFQPAPRVRADVDKDLSSVQRCLADSLVLLAEQQVGAGKLWLLPQAPWQEGETLRQTAERALTSLPAAGFNATFLSNAPCGVYKYKLPKAARTDSSEGTKVFFFKAVLSDIAPTTAINAPFMWLKKSELQRYLKPAYMMKVERFILDL
ncbi:39S ribosomal protein L46, mitochondrial isoform X1 [Hippoglossus hippoglossus]|uniref:39S ribosomal protein L46, mitochondrial isoform X1 n=1 Tax=Hippoglossus hippoglossus TaxID=8267 RepID=UPI00148D2CE3|nr:39S ribosomal protein L46, mitochondrial isoform X1 [Hippoglossus hippoglossus]